MVATIDAPLCEKLVKLGAGGDKNAQRELVDHLYPYWLNRIRSHRGVRALGNSPDYVLDIAARLAEKLMSPAVLSGYIARKGDVGHPGFAPWIRKVTENECAGYVRAALGKAAVTDEKGVFTLSPKRLLNELMASPVWEEIGVRPPITDIQTAGEVVRFADSELPKLQVAALRLWLQGLSFDEMAHHLESTEKEALAALRNALATLRRKFRVEAEDELA